VFPQVLRTAPVGDADFLEKALIGVYAHETYPRTSAENGFIDFRRFLFGIDVEHRARRLRELLAVTPDDLSAAAKRLASGLGDAAPVILAGSVLAERAARELGVEPRELPV
jgi:Zn-dependent M16 (insulinase) family peptidase